MRTLLGLAIATLVFIMCGGSSDDDRPPPPRNPNQPNTPLSVVQPGGGQVMVTVNANSTPPGAAVTGGGRLLGTTPLATQVPVPAPVPGQQQTFAFTFSMQGYQPATINASPVNNMITITAALAPLVMPGPGPIPVPVGGVAIGGGNGNVINVNGRGGGPIFDNHTTYGQAEVTQPCTIQSLQVRLVGNHTYFSDLAVSLRSPDGENFSLQRHARTNPFRSYSVRRAAGHQAQGQWVVSVADTVAQDSGALRDWGMTINCR